MAAGLGFKDFVTGEVLTAADVDGYLMQGTWVFANAAARSAAVTSPQEGNMSYLKDTNSTEYYSGSAWVAIGGASGGMTLISEQVASANSSLSFTSIAGTYKQLFLIWSGIYHSATGSAFAIRFNSSTNTYWGNALAGVSSGFATGVGFNETSISKTISSVNLAPFGSNANFSTTDNNAQANGTLLIDNYASTTKYKSFETNYGFYDNANSAYASMKLNAANSDTAAITSIDIVRLSGTATFTNATNTTIRLYGIS
jgi:hypothetical protein